MKNQKRYNHSSGVIQSIEGTPQGGIRVKAAVCRAGILEYPNAMGGVRRELHIPEEIFELQSIESLNSAPVTKLHPDDMVSADNYHQVTRGHVAEGSIMPSEDAQLLLTTLVIQDAELVSLVLNDEYCEISPGYTCDVEFVSGEWEGLKYDAIQRNIRYNHIAVGPSGWGRSGSEVSIRFDSKVEVGDLEAGPGSLCIAEQPTSLAEEKKVEEQKEDSVDTVLFTDNEADSNEELTMPETPTAKKKHNKKDSKVMKTPYITKSTQVSLLEKQTLELQEKLLLAQKRIDELEVVAEQATEVAQAEAKLLSDLVGTAEKFGVDLELVDATDPNEIRKAVILTAIPGFEFPEMETEEVVVEDSSTSEDEVKTDAEGDQEVTAEEVAAAETDKVEEQKTDSAVSDAYIMGAYDVAVAVLTIREATEVRVDRRDAFTFVAPKNPSEMTLNEKLAFAKREAYEAKKKAWNQSKEMFIR